MFSSKLFRDRIDREQLVEDCDSDHHIYENVTNRYKHRILNGIISSFTFKAKDYSLLQAKKRDKHIQIECPTSMNENNLTNFLNQLDDDTSIFERNFEYQMDYENSYTSCEDDNIYENLEFFNDDSFNNSSLNDWILNLTNDIAEYDTDNIMFVKSIPSVFSVKRNSQNFHRQLNKNEITLNFLKILWNGENNVDIMSLLLQTFSNLLRDQNKQRQSLKCNSTDCSSLATKSSSNEKVSRRQQKPGKKIDKIFYQKCENLILSTSLNVLVITYNKSLKLFFILAYSEILFKQPTSVKVKQIIYVTKNHSKLKFQSNLDSQEFYSNLTRFLRRKIKELRKDSKENCALEISNSENIYQQIWTCQSVSSHNDNTAVINSENIYSSLDYARAFDDSDWEVDHEFSFMNVIACDEKMMNQNDYKTVWVHYSDKYPEYNKIFYDSPGMELSALNETKEIIHRDESSVFRSDLSVDPKIVPDVKVPSVKSDVNIEIPQNLHESIEAWKSLIRSPYYCEDEDEYDIFVSESILSSKFSYYCDVEDENSKSVTVHSSNISLQLDESSSSTSFHESYRSLGEDVVDIDEKVTNSPKKEKERFRDKLKSKLNLKTVKFNVEGNSTESIVSKTEDDTEKFLIFGCSLEKIEKDNYHKDVPKIIVDCVNILELDMNIKTPGIYRISGNKNTIDAIRKKFNEKKQSKKESRQAFLQSQDVHTLTGLLKMFFRELKTPLLTQQTFIQCTSDKHSADQMGKILREMPIYNYATLKFLFKHFKIIEKYQDENLMNSGNLAICLGLCLFSNSFGEAPNPFDNDISKCNTLCKYLIDNYYEIFESNDEAR